MQKQGLGDALPTATDSSLHCSLKKLIVLGSECLIHVPGNDSGHEQRDSRHVSTSGVLFPLVSAPISFPGMLCLWKAQRDILRDLHLLCANRHSLGGSRKAKASLEHTPGLPTRREDYFWIEALAHCHLWQNSHWSPRSQNFTSVAAILTPSPFCLGTSSQHNKGLNSASSFCVMNHRQKSWNPSHKQPNTHQTVKTFKTLPTCKGFKPASRSMMFCIGTPC